MRPNPSRSRLGSFGLIAALAALLIAGQAISRQLQSNRDDLEVSARARRRPGDDVGRRPSGTPCRHHCRVGHRRRVGGRVISGDADRTGAPPRTLARRIRRLDSACRWLGGVDRRPFGGHHRDRRQECPASNHRAATVVGLPGLESRRRCGGVRDAGTRGHWSAVRARARSEPTWRAGAIGPVGLGVGRRGGCFYPHFRERSTDPRVTPSAVRMELELRDRRSRRREVPDRGPGSLDP